MAETTPNAGKKVIDAEGARKLALLRDTVNALVAHHFPDAVPDVYAEGGGIFGLDKHPKDGMHAARIFEPFPGDVPMLHFAYNFAPDAVTQDHALRSNDTRFDAFRSDLRRLFTGTGAGEQIEVPVEWELDQTPARMGKKEMVSASLSEQYHSLNIILHGQPLELYERMQRHLADNADLRDIAPKQGRIK